MLEEWGKQAVTFGASLFGAFGILKFFSQRELARMDAAVSRIDSKADGEKTAITIDKCIDRMTALELSKADRTEIAQAIAKIEAALERHAAARARMHERFERHSSELSDVDKKLTRLVGHLDGLRAAGVLPAGPPQS